MSEISIGRSEVAQTAIVSFAILTAVLLLGYVLAYWTWQWLAPRPVARAPVAVEVADTLAAQRLFGAAQHDRTTAVPTARAIRLLGVAAAAGRDSGYAVVRLDTGKTLVVREGEDLSAGIRLLEVHADHVVLERGGARETLAWPQKAGIR